ncbi:MAG: terminase small subunit [Pseudomonadota bacterium]|nr:terminase small subunit [Pseudomonadota bacterium]
MGMTVSKKTMADMIGKSPRWVDKLIDAGMPTKGGGGRGRAVEIDSQEAIDWLIRQELAKHIGDEDEDGEEGGRGGGSEDRQLKRARREKLQIEIDKERGRLVPADTVVEIMTRYSAIFASQLDALPSRLAQQVVTIDDPAQARHVMLTECRRVRAATADGIIEAARQLGREVDSIGDLDVDAAEGATTEDG